MKKKLSSIKKMHEFESQQRKIKQLRKTQNQRKNWANSYQGETGPNGNAHTYEDVTNKGKKGNEKSQEY